MMRRPVALFAAAAALSVVAQAADAQQGGQTQPPAPGPLRPFVLPKTEEFTLPNGLRVVVVEQHAMPVVSGRLIVDAGTLYEPAEKNGLATLTGNLLDAGTRTLSSTQLAERMEELGAQLGTSAGYTQAWINVTSLRDAFAEAMTVAATTITEPAFPAAEFERQRNQAIAGYVRSQATVEGLAAQTFSRAIWEPGAAYSRLPGGTRTSLATITRDDVVQWHRSMYSPANSTLLIVGDITPADARRVATQAFGGWQAPKGARPATNTAVQRPAGNRVILVDRPGSVQSAIYIGQGSIGRTDPDFFRLTALAHVLGGTNTMRVGKNLRERRGWTYGAGAILNPLRESGSFFVVSSVRTNATDSALVEAASEYRRIAREPVPEAELKGAINNLVGSFPTSMQTVQELSGRVQTLLLYGLPLDYYATYRENLAAITPADITQAAQKHLTPDALTLVVVGDLSKIEAPVRAANLGTVEVWDADGKKVR